MASPQLEDGFLKISNELFEAIIMAVKLLPKYEAAVFLAIVRLTYGYNKKEAKISQKELGELTRILPPHLTRAKKALIERNMIEVGKNGIKIQKNYELWWLAKLPHQVTENDEAKLPHQVTPVTSPGNSQLPHQVTPVTSPGNSQLPHQVTPVTSPGNFPLEAKYNYKDKYKYNYKDSLVKEPVSPKRASLSETLEKSNRDKIQEIVDKWNKFAKEEGLAGVIIIKPSGVRYKRLLARLAEKEFNFDQILEEIRNSSFLKGDNNNGWRVTFDWIICPSNYPKILEGQYRGTKNIVKKEDQDPELRHLIEGFGEHQGRMMYERMKRQREEAQNG